MNYFFWRSSFLAIFFLLFLISPVLAARPFLDSGTPLSVEDPYLKAINIANIFEQRAIHGKLEGETPLDLYSFIPDKDGEQTFSLLAPKEGALVDEQTGQLILVFIDPTDATPEESLSIPLPGEGYHASVLRGVSPVKEHREPVLIQDFFLVAEQKIKLQSGKTYYMFVGSVQSNILINRYMIKVGEGQAWTAVTLLRHPLDWLRFKTNAYGARTPFQFSPKETLSFLLFLLGLAVLAGMALFQELLSFWANRSASAAYTLIKMQPQSRAVIWVSLWFMIIAGAAYFDQVGWLGLPFVLLLLSFPIIANMLYVTLKISPLVSMLTVEDKKGEATIPFSLRKRWFFSTLVSLFSFGAFLTFLAMYLVAK